MNIYPVVLVGGSLFGTLEKRLVEIMITLLAHYRIRRIILQNKGLYYGYQDMYLQSSVQSNNSILLINRNNDTCIEFFLPNFVHRHVLLL